MFDLTPERDEAYEDDQEDERRLVCAACRATVGRVTWIGPVLDGPARRVFFNPAGVVMEVVTLRRTVGVRPVGTPTREFTPMLRGDFVASGPRRRPRWIPVKSDRRNRSHLR